MRILLLNNNPVVSKLVTLSAQKTSDDLSVADDVGAVEPSKYDLLVVDDALYSDEDMQKLKSKIEFTKSLFICSRDAEIPSEFKHALRKPFLPTDLVEMFVSLSKDVNKKPLDNAKSKSSIESESNDSENLADNINLDELEDFGELDELDDFDAADLKNTKEQSTSSSKDDIDELESLDDEELDFNALEELAQESSDKHLNELKLEDDDIDFDDLDEVDELESGDDDLDFVNMDEKSVLEDESTGILDKDELKEVQSLLDETEDEASETKDDLDKAEDDDFDFEEDTDADIEEESKEDELELDEELDFEDDDSLEIEDETSKTKTENEIEDEDDLDFEEDMDSDIEKESKEDELELDEELDFEEEDFESKISSAVEGLSQEDLDAEVDEEMLLDIDSLTSRDLKIAIGEELSEDDEIQEDEFIDDTLEESEDLGLQQSSSLNDNSLNNNLLDDKNEGVEALKKILKALSNEDVAASLKGMKISINITLGDK